MLRRPEPGCCSQASDSLASGARRLGACAGSHGYTLAWPGHDERMEKP